MRKPKLIYIAGYGRSGSTILDTLLSNCEKAWGWGEASNLFQCLKAGDKCSCSEQINHCRAWAPFVANQDFNTLDREQRQAESIFKWRALNKNSSYYRFWQSIAQYARDEEVTIVDSSKISRVTYNRAFNLQQLGFDVTLVYLYRDSQGLLSSLMKGSNKELAGRERKASKSLFLIRSFFGALAANTFTLIAAKSLGNCVFIKYSDLVNDPHRVIELLGLTPIKQFSLDSLSPGHGVSGNRLRKPGEKISFRRDGSEPGIKAPFFFRKLYSFLDVYDQN